MLAADNAWCRGCVNAYPVRDEDAARLSPLGYAHIDILGRYSFPALSAEQTLRPLRDPEAATQ
ncbi:hypothetical protein [Nocardia sp. NPDC059691]|uniref:hypothetical protein n=1 Tax=Nocardia sp. NPDC059691 TaxID=3346908 RepID=UPI003695E080